MKFVYSILCAIFLLSKAHAESKISVVDRYMSPYAGAENLYTIHKSLDSWENRCLDPTKVWGGYWGNVCFRFLELNLIWEPFNYLSVVTQHEIFGHGYRVRSLTDYYAKVKGYKIGVPPPYGHGGGATLMKVSPEHASFSQLMLIDIAGVESTAILAERVRNHWVSLGRVNPREASLYQEAMHDITFYVLSMKRWCTDRGGHDIENYVHELNWGYPEAHLTRSHLRKEVLINLLDPFTYFSIYASWKYIFTGKDTQLPMIPMGKVKYLPTPRLGLTPFGPEIFLENYMVFAESPIYFYGKGGTHAHNKYYGIGVEKAKIWVGETVSLGCRLDGFWQPTLLKKSIWQGIYEGSFAEKKGKSFLGLSAYGIVEYSCKKKSDVSLLLHLGWKTKGFVPGETYKNSPIIRLGLASQF